MLLIQHWFYYLKQQMEEINGTLKTLGRYYKKGSSHQQNSFSNKEFEQKNHLKNFFKSQKNGKKGKTM